MGEENLVVSHSELQHNKLQNKGYREAKNTEMEETGSELTVLQVRQAYKQREFLWGTFNAKIHFWEKRAMNWLVRVVDEAGASARQDREKSKTKVFCTLHQISF